jgi:hypothetical protein
VFIIGPQGSGSSCLAGALHVAGISMGSNLRGPSPLNPKGHFEDLPFELLASKEDVIEREREFRTYFEERNKSPLWGLKSYQIAFRYKYVLPYVNCRILSIDRPEEGAIKSSLVKYGRFRTREFIEHMHSLIRFNRKNLIEEYGLYNLDVNFNELTDNPVDLIPKIISFCCEGIDAQDINVQAAISFVDPKLNHKRELQ